MTTPAASPSGRLPDRPSDRLTARPSDHLTSAIWATGIGVFLFIYLPLVVALGATDAPGAVEKRWTPSEIAFVAQSGHNPAAVARSVEAAVRALDPGVPTYGARVMTDILAQASARTSFTLVLLAIASAVAMTIFALTLAATLMQVWLQRRAGA